MNSSIPQCSISASGVTPVVAPGFLASPAGEGDLLLAFSLPDECAGPGLASTSATGEADSSGKTAAGLTRSARLFCDLVMQPRGQTVAASHSLVQATVKPAGVPRDESPAVHIKAISGRHDGKCLASALAEDVSAEHVGRQDLAAILSVLNGIWADHPDRPALACEITMALEGPGAWPPACQPEPQPMVTGVAADSPGGSLGAPFSAPRGEPSPVDANQTAGKAPPGAQGAGSAPDWLRIEGSTTYTVRLGSVVDGPDLVPMPAAQAAASVGASAQASAAGLHALPAPLAGRPDRQERMAINAAPLSGTNDAHPEKNAQRFGKRPAPTDLNPERETKKLYPTDNKLDTYQLGKVGTRFAYALPAMTEARNPNASDELLPLSGGIAVTGTVKRDGATGEAQHSSAQLIAHKAVEAVNRVVDLQFDTHSRVSQVLEIRLKLAGEDLAIKIDLRGGEVQTQFKTSSQELCHAIAQQWNAVRAESPDRFLRFQAPEFLQPDMSSDLGNKGGMFRQPDPGAEEAIAPVLRQGASGKTAANSSDGGSDAPLPVIEANMHKLSAVV